MTSSVCQGLQTCLEPWPPEPCYRRPKVYLHKLNSSASLECYSVPDFAPQVSKDTQNDHEKSNKISNNDGNDETKVQNSGGWSFLESLSGNCQSSNANENEKVYVHPLSKRSASLLSTISLEMCTESLGSETGTDVNESISDEKSLYSLETHEFQPKERSRFRETLLTRKNLNRDGSFPPPLSSMGRSKAVQFKPHREGGRLVLEAVAANACGSCFHAERREGRLTLRFLEDFSFDFNREASKEEEEDEEEEEVADEFEIEDENGDDVEEEDEQEEELMANCDGGEGKFSSNSRSRCKEGGRGNKQVVNWEPYWVAA